MQDTQKAAGAEGKKAAGVKKPGATKRRRGKGFINFILFVGLVAAVALFVWAENQRRDVVDRLQETQQELEQIRESTQQSGAQVAQQVLEQVRQHFDIPVDPEPTVATITDIERLREANEFYRKGDNGDHLIITENRAILFDPDRNIILDVVPVQIGSDAAPGDGEAPAEGEEGEAAADGEGGAEETEPFETDDTGGSTTPQ